jgi:hypothetical protein
MSAFQRFWADVYCRELPDYVPRRLAACRFRDPVRNRVSDRETAVRLMLTEVQAASQQPRRPERGIDQQPSLIPHLNLPHHPIPNWLAVIPSV